MENENKMLILVDLQYDFINGSLVVDGAEEMVNRLTKWYEEHRGEYKRVVATLDMHPIDHCSFIEYGGQFPIHCLLNSKGAAIYDDLLKLLLEDCFAFFIKGCISDTEEYSIFDNGKKEAAFNKLMKLGKIDSIDICGLCGDYCVGEHIQKLIELGHKDKIRVLTDFVCSIDGGKALEKQIKDNQLKIG